MVTSSKFVFINAHFFRIAKPDEIKSITSASTLGKLDMEKDGFFLDLAKIEVGFLAKKHLDANRLHISDKEIFTFRNEYRNFVVSVIKKLLDKSPVIYGLCCSLECLDPHVFFDKQSDRSIQLFKSMLSKLASLKQVDETHCDSLLSQFLSARQEFRELSFKKGKKESALGSNPS